MSPELEAVVASPRELGDACEAVDQVAAQAGFDSRESYALQLAVCEALENIFAHGYPADKPGSIHLTIRSNNQRLEVQLVDSAPPFNPAGKDPRPPTPPEDPPAGGLGIYIMHQVMDEISYERRAGQNRLTLAKWVGDHSPH